MQHAEDTEIQTKRAGLDKITHPSPSSRHQKYNIHGFKTVAKEVKEGDHTK